MVDVIDVKKKNNQILRFLGDHGAVKHRDKYPLISISLEPDEYQELRRAAERYGYIDRRGTLPGGLVKDVLMKMWGYLSSIGFDPAKISIGSLGRRKQLSGAFEVRSKGEIADVALVLSRFAGKVTVGEFLRPAVETFLATEQQRLGLTDAQIVREASALKQKPKKGASQKG